MVATVVIAAVGVFLLTLLVVGLSRQLARFSRARADLRAEARAGLAQLRALAPSRRRLR